MFEIHWTTIAAAFVLDFILGDPARLPHPIVLMGKAIEAFERFFRKYISNLMVSGALFAVSLITGAWVSGLILVRAGAAVHPFFGHLVEIILLFFCFSAKTLDKEAMRVFWDLEKKDIFRARKSIARIVGRQTDRLDERGITRACVETVAENFVDGFLSPLFFAVIGGVPCALAYKMVNTLDSMVGYQNEQYLFFGRVSARIDDAANFIPARLSVILISLGLGFFSLKQGLRAFKTGFSQGRQHKSPNAGFPEAAFAGALNVRLGGPSIYHGKVVEKPFIGSAFRDPDRKTIPKACGLMLWTAFLAVLISCFILFVF